MAKELSLAKVRELAEFTTDALSGLNGDPSKRASWIRERKLAHIVVALLDRIENVTATVTVPE